MCSLCGNSNHDDDDCGDAFDPSKSVLFNSAHGLSDSGQRESFNTGAMREPNLGRGRYDLISPIALLSMYQIMRDPSNLSAEVLHRLAVHYENGAIKYADRNWEKGLPLSRHLNSAIRHIQARLKGDRSEDNHSACIWNIFCIIHQLVKMKDTEINDLVYYMFEPRILGIKIHSHEFKPLLDLYTFMSTGQEMYLIYACEECMIIMNEEEK